MCATHPDQGPYILLPNLVMLPAIESISLAGSFAAGCDVITVADLDLRHLCIFLLSKSCRPRAVAEAFSGDAILSMARHGAVFLIAELFNFHFLIWYLCWGSLAKRKRR